MSYSREDAANYKVGYLDALQGHSVLKQWLCENGYMQPGATKGKPFTHAFLNGGTALVPDDKHETFLKMYAEDIDKNVAWSIHENATRFSRLYFDFDISEPNCEYGSEIHIGTLQRWAALLQRAAFQFFPDAAECPVGGSIVVLVRPPTFSFKRPASAPAKMITFGSTGSSIINNVNTEDPKMVATQLALAERIRTGTFSFNNEIATPLLMLQQKNTTPKNSNGNEGSTPTRKTSIPVQRGYVQTPSDFDRASLQMCFSSTKSHCDEAPNVPATVFFNAAADSTAHAGNAASLEQNAGICIRKSGVHFIFPKLVCDLNHMLQVREQAVKLFKKAFPHAPGGVEWETIIDPAIYTGNSGLRMPYSYKVETCSACKAGERKRLKCLECANQPRRLVPLSYRPIMYLGTNHEHMSASFEALVRKPATVLLRCSLRQPLVHEPSFRFERPKSLGPYCGVFIKYALDESSPENSSWANAKRETCYAGGSGGNGSMLLTDGARKRKGSAVANGVIDPILIDAGVSAAVARRKILFEYGKEEPIAIQIENFLRTNTCRQWRNISVSKVQTLESRAFGARNGEMVLKHSVKVCGDGANFCLNVQREHTSSSIYFIITPDGVFQRCFCRKQTLDGRLMGVQCSQFISHAFSLESQAGCNLYNMLFPQTGKSELEQALKIASESNEQSLSPATNSNHNNTTTTTITTTTTTTGIGNNGDQQTSALFSDEKATNNANNTETFENITETTDEDFDNFYSSVNKK